MKFVAVVFLLFALFGLSLGLKHKDCGLAPAADGANGIRCFASFNVFTYHPEKNACERFLYGGCGGNSNRFDTLEKCEAKCKE